MVNSCGRSTLRVRGRLRRTDQGGLNAVELVPWLFRPRNGLSAAPEYASPNPPATVSLKPTRTARRPTAIRTAWSARALFLNYFDLFIDHLTGELVDRNMHPVTLLTFNNKGRKARVRSRELKSTQIASIGEHLARIFRCQSEKCTPRAATFLK